MIYENGDLVFSSGRKYFGTNGGIIGIDDSLDVFGGYDSKLFPPLGYSKETFDLMDDLDRQELPTKEDLVELAEFMIDRWKAFKLAAEGGLLV